MSPRSSWLARLLERQLPLSDHWDAPARRVWGQSREKPVTARRTSTRCRTCPDHVPPDSSPGRLNDENSRDTVQNVREDSSLVGVRTCSRPNLAHPSREPSGNPTSAEFSHRTRANGTSFMRETA